MISLEKSVSTRQFPVNKVIKFGPCWEVPYLWLVTYWQWHYRISSENGARLITKTTALMAAAPFPFLSPLSCFSPPPLPFFACHAGYYCYFYSYYFLPLQQRWLLNNTLYIIWKLMIHHGCRRVFRGAPVSWLITGYYKGFFRMSDIKSWWLLNP